MTNCGICKRSLDNPNDPLSINIGGDCIHCMIDVESSIGDINMLRKLVFQLLTSII